MRLVARPPAVDAARLESARKANAKRRAPQEVVAYERTRRYARGRIVDRLRDLPAGRRISLLDLHAVTPALAQRTSEEVREIVAGLKRDGLITLAGNGVALRE